MCASRLSVVSSRDETPPPPVAAAVKHHTSSIPAEEDSIAYISEIVIQTFSLRHCAFMRVRAWLPNMVPETEDEVDVEHSTSMPVCSALSSSLLQPYTLTVQFIDGFTVPYGREMRFMRGAAPGSASLLPGLRRLRPLHIYVLHKSKCP